MIVIIIHIFSLRRIIFKGKTIASVPVAMLELASETELGYHRSKKIIKSLQNEIEVLKSKNASLETDNNTLKEKLNRNGSNGGIGESSCTEMIKVSLQKTTKIEASLKTTLEGIFIMIYISKYLMQLSLLWSDEDLSHRSLTGKKHYNSKEIKQPLTPEKRLAIEEAFKDRLKKQQYHDATIALELKLVNRYIAEKINDVRKCTSRRNLNMTYDIQGC
ncbi:hypothetical protein Avbf_14479 [Armadillidium vulgare]|nr:hypothetical protein Avbf_14479 [Armadillidium vulgare]